MIHAQNLLGKKNTFETTQTSYIATRAKQGVFALVVHAAHPMYIDAKIR